MKITGLQVSNFMRISCIDFQVSDKGTFRIGADNGEGKTSLYTFLEACFGGKDKLPPMPVKTGETKALGKLTLDDDGRCVTIEVTVQPDRTLTAKVRQDGGPALSSPMTLLRSLVNKFTFDPFALLRLTGREQRNKFLECLGVDYSDLDRQAEDLRREQSECGRDVHGREKQISTMPEYAGVPQDEISTSELAAQLKKAIEYNQLAQQWMDRVAICSAGLHDAEEALERAKVRVAEANEELKAAKAKYATFKPVLVEPIQKQIDSADAINAKIRANKARASLVAQFEQDREVYKGIGKRLEAVEAEKVKRLAAAKAPVDGITFTDDGVFYNGLPLSQESGSGQMIRAVELVAALNPTLRTIFVDDAERMLSGRLNELNEWAQKNDYQIFAFIATETGEGCQVIIEDGQLKGVE